MAMITQLVSTDTISWSGGQEFDGFVILTLNLPTGYDYAVLRTISPRLRVPAKTKIPVSTGVYDTNSSHVWRTDYLVPPGAYYTAAWYDSTGKLVASDATQRTITADSYTLDPPTLTEP